MSEPQPRIDELLERLNELRGSDLHLKVGSPPAFRVSGDLTIGDFPVLTAPAVAVIADELMSDVERRKLDKTGDVDFSFGRPALGRFRVHAYRQRGSTTVAIRAIGSGTFSFEELGLPHAVEDMCRADAGLVIVTGGAASGKTTTLSAMVDHINRTRRASIVTIEDPIEVLHSDKMSLVSQREVGIDTDSVADGLNKAMRQDADVVYVSEVDDVASIEGAFQLARTGHLVLTSMKTADVVDTVDRIVSVFPTQEHDRVRRIMAGAITAIVSQRLMARSDEAGLVAAVEVMINTGRATDALRGMKDAPPLRETIADGAYFGMQSFDQALLRLTQKGQVSFQDALNHATDPTDFKLAVQTVGLRSA